jgi:hypothetical protein
VGYIEFVIDIDIDIAKTVVIGARVVKFQVRTLEDGRGLNCAPSSDIVTIMFLQKNSNTVKSCERVRLEGLRYGVGAIFIVGWASKTGEIVRSSIQSVTLTAFLAGSFSPSKTPFMYNLRPLMRGVCTRIECQGNRSIFELNLR